MPVYKFSEDQLEPAYGIECRRILGRDGVLTPFGAHTCKVPPGGRSAPHAHLEGEVFLIARGKGTITIGSDSEEEVGPGDVVFIPSQTEHVLVNASSTEALWFTSVWWDPRGADQPEPPQATLLMAAPPTPNGDLHLGHLSGPYLALDAMARIRRQQGVQVCVACGSDEHQTYVVTKARQRAETPLQTADHFAARNQATLKGLGIMVDTWLRPLHDASYKKRVLECLAKLREQGHVKLQAIPTAWCPDCDCALVEAHISGLCPHCGEETSGNGCEACFVPNICSDLKEPKCGGCGQAASIRDVERLIFPLEPWLPQLREWCENLTLPSWLAQLADKLRSCPTPYFPISHPGDWGIEVPDIQQRLFAWWEMPIGFLEFDQTGVWDNPEAEVLQSFGSDNAWYYLTILPATLLALNPQTVLPKGLLTNRFLNLDGDKFSTSRGHAIWGEEALQFLSADVIRLGLASVRPESEESDFTLEGLKETLKSRGLRWQTWWQSVGRLGLQEYPSSVSPWTEEEKTFHSKLVRIWKAALPAREAAGFSLRIQLERLDELVDLAESFQPQGATGGALANLAVGIFARLCEPVMPGIARQLSQAVGVRLVADATCSLPTPGTAVESISKIELGNLQQVESLKQSRQALA